MKKLIFLVSGEDPLLSILLERIKKEYPEKVNASIMMYNDWLEKPDFGADMYLLHQVSGHHGISGFDILKEVHDAGKTFFYTSLDPANSKLDDYEEYLIEDAIAILEKIDLLLEFGIHQN